MVNIKPVSRPLEWPPRNSTPYKVLNSDDWGTVARQFHLDALGLIHFNFKTIIPEEVNWYLKTLIGCRVPGPRGFNYTFKSADPNKGLIYIPMTPPPPIPKSNLDFPHMLQKLWIENGNKRDPRQHRIECLLATLDQGVDDRVIFWEHIAPGPYIPIPPMVRPRTINTGVDVQWFYNTIKTMRDVEIQPTGNGLGFNKFVTSLKKAFVELQPNLTMLYSFHDDIVATHTNLQKWSSVDLGGSSLMPVEYRAVKDWIAQKESDPKSVLNCVIVA